MIVNIRPNRYRRVTLIAVIAAAVLVVGGTVFALVTNTTTWSGVTSSVTSVLTGKPRVSLKVDHPTLPADGISQTRITVVTSKPNIKAEASIVSGGGKIDAHPDDPNRIFVYTAGTQSGNVQILIQVGSAKETANITLIAGKAPKPPVLVAPPDGSTTNDPRPEVAGIALSNAHLVITTDGNQNTVGQADDQGVFKIALEKPLSNGQHTISVSSVNELGQTGQTSNLVTITVKADPVKIDADNIRTSPKQIVAGTSFGLFIPVSLNTSRVVVELQDQTYELVNPHGSSVFSGLLVAPTQAGTYSANVILYDTGDNPTHFDKLLSFNVAASK